MLLQPGLYDAYTGIAESLTQLYNTRIWCIKQTQANYKAMQGEVLAMNDAEGQVSPPPAISNPLPVNPEPHEPPQSIREPRKHYQDDRCRQQTA